MSTCFSLGVFLFVFYLVLALLFIRTYILSLGVWDPKFTNPELSDRAQLWPVLPPVTVNYFLKKLHRRCSTDF